MTVSIQGKAAEFGKVFVTEGKAYLLKSGCFGSLDDVIGLQVDHSGNNLATTNGNLEIYAGDDALIFRCSMKDFAEQLSDMTDVVETYLPVSAGFTITKSETVVCEGVPIEVIVEAKLNEISVCSGDPVIDTTYARLISDDTCCSLADDYERFQTVGRFIGLHRKAVAVEEDDEIKYTHIASSYEVLADRFQRLLSALA